MFRIALTLLVFIQWQASAAALIETVAGVGRRGFSGDGGPAVQAEINEPYGLVVGPDGALYFCDMGNHRIRRVDSSGVISTVAGNGAKGWSGDNGPATAAQLNEPYEIRFDRAGNLFCVEMRNNVVRRIDAKTQTISTLVGPEAGLKQPHSIQFINEHELWICDIGNHRIQSYDFRTGKITTVGGTGQRVSTYEGLPLLGNPLNGPRAIDIAPDGVIWLALREGNRIYRVEGENRIIRPAAGSGASGMKDGPALAAALSGPKGITVAKNGWVLWADTESHTIRYLDPIARTVQTLAGTGTRGDGPDGDALKCGLARPHGVCADAHDYLWIGDSENHRIRRIKLR